MDTLIRYTLHLYGLLRRRLGLNRIYYKRNGRPWPPVHPGDTIMVVPGKFREFLTVDLAGQEHDIINF